MGLLRAIFAAGIIKRLLNRSTSGRDAQPGRGGGRETRSANRRTGRGGGRRARR